MAAPLVGGFVPQSYSPPNTFSVPPLSSTSNPVPVAGAAFGGGLTAGGRAAPVAGPTIVLNSSIDARGATQESIPQIRQAMAEMEQRIVQAIPNLVSRGGSYAAAFRGRS